MKHFFLLLISVAVLFNFGTAQNATQYDVNGDVIPPEALIAHSMQQQMPANAPGMSDMRAEWLGHGPWGGNIRGFATNAVDGMNVVVACGHSQAGNGGMWYSNDGGQTWNATNIGNKVMYGVAAHPSEDGVFYAGGKYGIYESTDGGMTWELMAMPSTTIIGFGVQRANTDLMIAGIASNQGVKYSDDGGATWNATNLSLGYMKDFAVSPANPELMFLAVSGNDGSGLYTSTDGATWTAINPAGSGQCYGVYVDPEDADFVLLGADNGIFKSTDGGANWTQVQSTSNFARGIVNFDGTFYTCVYNGPIYESADNGDTWTVAEENIIERTWSAVGKSDAGALFGNWGSVIRGDGSTYQLSVEGLNNVYVHAVAYYADRNELWAGSEGSGLWVSNDHGETWTNKSNGLQGWWAYTFAPTNHEDWSVDRMMVATNNGAYYTDDYGDNWQALDQETTYYTGVLIDYTNPDFMGVTGATGPVKFTSDGGANWTVAAGLPFAFYPRLGLCENTSGDPRIVLLYEQLATNAYYSDDMGANFSECSGLSGVAYFTDISVRKADNRLGQKIYMSTDKGIYKSDDGESYTLCPQLNGLAWSVLGSQGTDVYAGANNGVFHSADEGETWETFNTGIDYIAIWDLKYGTSTDEIFAGTRGYSVYRYGDNVPPPTYELPFAEDFTGQQLPANWQNVDNVGSGQVWEFNNPGERDITGAGFDSDFAILDSDNYGSGNGQDADLITPAIDCSNASNVMVSFDQSFREYGESVGTLAVSNNGTDWTDVYVVEADSGYPNPAVHVAFDISAVAAGQSTVYIKWNYVGDWAYWWAIDNVEVYEGVPTYTLPFTEDFTGQQLPANWQNIDNNGDTLYWQFDNPGEREITGAGFDSDFAILDSDNYGNGAAQDADLITPPIDCSGVDYVNLAFDQSFRDYSGSAGTLSVSNNGTDWTDVYVVEADSGYPNPAVHVEFDISAVAAGQSTVYIKWNYVGDWAYWWAIDNVSVTEGSAPALIPPTNLSATVDMTTVTLNWDAPEAESLTGYNVYRDNTLVTLNPVTDTTYTDEYVVAGTHLYRVTAVYDAGESDPTAPVQVMIEGNVGKIQGFVRDAVTHLTVDAATITAEGVDNGALTQMTPFGAHYSMLLTAGTYTVTCTAEGYETATAENLLVEEGVNKGYTFYLQPLPGETLTGIGENDANGYSIYPNPATDVLNISGTNISKVEILNQSGQLVRSANDINGKQSLNIADLPAGVYFVKVTNSTSVNTEKLIVK